MTSATTLLRESIRLYRAHASVYAGYAAWALLPFAGFLLISLLPQQQELLLPLSLAFEAVYVFVWIWIGIILILLTPALASRGTKKIEPMKLRANVRTLLLPVLVVAALQTLIMIGGLLLLVIPGLVFWAWFAFAPYAAVFEGKRGLDALAASREMVRGRFLAVLGRLAYGPFIVILAYLLLFGLVFVAFFDPAAAGEGTLIEPPLWLIVLEELVSALVIAPLMIIYGTLLYLEVRRPDPEHVTNAA